VTGNSREIEFEAGSRAFDFGSDSVWPGSLDFRQKCVSVSERNRMNAFLVGIMEKKAYPTFGATLRIQGYNFGIDVESAVFVRSHSSHQAKSIPNRKPTELLIVVIVRFAFRGGEELRNDAAKQRP
jgi:hypothetical protein